MRRFILKSGLQSRFVFIRLRFVATVFSALGAIFSTTLSLSAQPRPLEATAKPKPRLITSRSYDETGKPVEYRYLDMQGISQFVAKANEYAKEGYRLHSVTAINTMIPAAERGAASEFDGVFVAAIFKLSKDSRYEYDWFEAFNPGQVVTRANARAEKGLYIRAGVSLTDSSGCSDSSDSNDPLGQIMAYVCMGRGDIFFMERDVGKQVIKEYRVLLGRWGWGKSPTAELDAEMTEATKTGFRPVWMTSARSGFNEATAVVIERDKESATPLTDQFRYIKSEFGFSKKVNAAAQDGYKIIIAGQMIAFRHVVMRKEPNSAPASYVWIKPETKNADLELESAITAGIEYENNNREMQELIFRHEKTTPYHYKLLGMNPTYPKSTKLVPNPAPLITQEQILSEFDALVMEGYIPRSVVYARGTKVVFERARK